MSEQPPEFLSDRCKAKRDLAADARPAAQNLAALTALRFPAALAILIHHCNGVFWPAAALGPLDAGVSFFFVLSGYILTHVYGGSVVGAVALRRFYVARIARIWPLHLLCLAATLLLVAVPEPEPFRAGALISNALMLHAWVPFDRYFFSYNYVSWSISTELFFYLAFPFLVRRSRVALLVWLCISLAGVAALVLVSYEDGLPVWDTAYDRLSSTGLLYTNPLARIAEFMTGIVAARFVAARTRRFAVQGSSIANGGKLTVPAAMSWRWTMGEVAAVMLFLVGFLDFRTSAGFFAREVVALVGAIGLPGLAGAPPGPAIAAIGTEWLHHVGLAPFAVVAIMVFAQQRGWFSRWLARPICVFLGEASFALYLVHQIGLRLMQQYGLAPPPGAAFHGTAFFGYLCVMLLLAALLHLAVERPARRSIVRWCSHTPS